MRRITLFLLLLASCCLYSGSALANTVTMKLTGVGGNNAGGVYTYPYYISVNGASSISLICDTYDRHIDIGESWTANVYGLLSGKGLFGNSHTAMLDYKAAGLIYLSILNGSLSANVGNFAIWGLFSANARSNGYFTTSGAAAVEAQYLGYAAVDPNSAYRGIVIYVPVDGTQGANMPVQEFLGYNPAATPEPATLTLFGTGLLSFLGLARRKLARL